MIVSRHPSDGRLRIVPDTVSPQERSAIMRRVKSKNTSLEKKVRSALHSRGLRYRLNYPLSGKPDLVFVRARVVVFIDSCYWHGCPEHLRMPSSNQEYWKAKIERNIKRDANVNASYANTEWHVVRIWEHQLKQSFDEVIDELTDLVRLRSDLHA